MMDDVATVTAQHAWRSPPPDPWYSGQFRLVPVRGDVGIVVQDPEVNLPSGEDYVSWFHHGSLRGWELSRQFQRFPIPGDVGIVVQDPEVNLPSREEYVSWSHRGSLRGWDVIPQRPRDSEPDIAHWAHHHALKDTHTFTPRIFFSFYHKTAQPLQTREPGRGSGIADYFWDNTQTFPPEAIGSSDQLLEGQLTRLLSTRIKKYPARIIYKYHERAVDKRSSRIAQMEETLRRFSELPENWDSYGGHAISPDAIEEARGILVAAIDLNLPEPWVAPGGDAGIGIQWDTDGMELYIDVVPKQQTTYVLAPKAENTVTADGALTTENLVGVLKQLAASAA